MSATLIGLACWGFCPHTSAAAQATAAQRHEEIVRMFREAKPSPVALLDAERAWTIQLGAGPSAGGAMDAHRIYIPLRQGLLVAIARETGLVAWMRTIDTSAPVVAGSGSVFVATRGAIVALDASLGADQWTTPVEMAVTAPLLWVNGWLIAVVEPGEVLAFRAADGHLIWRRAVGATSPHAAVSGDGGAMARGRHAVYLSLADGRLIALALESGELLWEIALPGTLSPPVVGWDRVFVGSTDNFFYAFDAESGREEWRWRNGGDVIGAAVDGDTVYLASLDNMLRAVKRSNGNQIWRKPTGARPVLPPSAFRGVVVLPGLMPVITVFVAETGAVMGTQTAPGDLAGPPLVDPAPKPFRIAFVTITREGVVEAFRPVAMMFREPKAVSVSALPGRPLARDRMDSSSSPTSTSTTPNTQP